MNKIPILLILFSLLIALAAYLIYILRKNKNTEEIEEVDDEKAIPSEMHGGSVQEASNEQVKIEESPKDDAVETETAHQESISQPKTKAISRESISKCNTSHKHSNRTIARDAKGRFVKSKNI